MSKALKKPTIFTAPDGREFTDRKEYRMYMMDTFFSFKSKHGEHENLVKLPNDVGGQSFNIADCVDCTMVIMDATEQVQIDNLLNCRVFIGACSSTVFIRSCHNCTFFCCSRQLRITGVTTSLFYSFCPSEIHIELCKALSFAPFLGGYPEQADHFKASGLDPSNNRWFDIYDHSDPNKKGVNWSLMDPSAYEAPWYPAGEVIAPFVSTDGPTADADESTGKAASQVGETFSRDQMIADADAAKRHEATGGAAKARASSQVTLPSPRPAVAEKVTVETALLIVTAESMDMDLSVWFNEKANNGVLPAREFTNKLVSLGTTLAMNQDPETKRELDLAIAPDSLRAAVAACAVPVGGAGGGGASADRMIDIRYFIHVCRNQVEEHIAELDKTQSAGGGGGSSSSISGGVLAQDSWISGMDFTAGTDRQSGARVVTDSMATALPATESELQAMYADDDGNGDEIFDYMEDDGGAALTAGVQRAPADADAADAAGPSEAGLSGRDPEAEAYLRDIMAKAGFNVERPKPPPAGTRGEMRGESVRDTFSPPSNEDAAPGAIHMSESAPVLQNHYDEEIAYDLYDEEEDIDSAYLKSRKQNGGQVPASIAEQKQYWEDQNRNLLNASSEQGFPGHHHSNSRDGWLKPRPSSAGPRLNNNNNSSSARKGSAAAVAAAAAGAGTTGVLHADHISRRLDHLARSTGEIRKRSSSAGRMRSSSGEPQHRRRKSFSSMPYDSRRNSSRVSYSAEDQLAAMKELVEDLVRETVKKADLYHVLQVNLGFIEAYTMIPPRGEIISSKKREWLSNRELQSAFIAARLCLTEPQIIILKGLVHHFAREFDSLYSSRASQIINVPASADNAAQESTAIRTRRANKVPHYASATGASRSHHHHIHRAHAHAQHGDETMPAEVKEKMPPSVLNTSHESAASGLTSKRSATAAEPGAAAGIKKSPTLGAHQTLSAAWLKKYLVHLRLTKKIAPSSGAGAGRVSTVGSGDGAGGAGGIEKVPLLWKEWLGKKMQVELRKGSSKPKDFERALSGLPHHLTKEDIDVMIRTYQIVPADLMQQEVECRIESWLLDMDGRRDFPHQMNVHIRKWIWAKIKDERIHLSPKDKKGNWKIWQRLPDEEKQQVKKDVLNTIIQEKREKLLSVERTHQTLTRELFDQYDTEARRKQADSEKPVEWNDWLQNHIEKFKVILQEFRQNEQERLMKLAQEQKQRKTVAGLNEVKKKLLKVKEDYQMNTFEESELLRALHELERVAEAKGIAKGTLVTKADFDRLMKHVLAPYIPLDGSAASPVKKPTADAVTRQDIEAMFFAEKDQAVEKVIELEQEQQKKTQKDFKEWMEEKNLAREQRIQEKRKARAAAKKEEEARKVKGKKAWKQWCLLRKKNMYKSMADKKKHVIPTAKVVAHKDRWNSDKELNDFYEEMEKKY